ncbi:MAG: hypothetical protein RBG13Loki_1516 [Promethearchaeota archaeon CR_4]|nr:MAG: hypothetical protein RBG13Loki_1516 [Candidatus Lokiarchaeota archaeon CR_4]
MFFIYQNIFEFFGCDYFLLFFAFTFTWDFPMNFLLFRKFIDRNERVGFSSNYKRLKKRLDVGMDYFY